MRKQARDARRQRLAEIGAKDRANRCHYCKKPLGQTRHLVIGGSLTEEFCSTDCIESYTEVTEAWTRAK